VVLVHGGFWRPAYDRTHLRPMAVALAERGCPVINVEYRRSGSNGWPAMRDDMLALAEWVGESLPGVAVGAGGDGPLPPAGARPRRVVLAGHSAGGQLVLWLAARPEATGVDAVVALAPVADLGAAAACGVGDGAVERTFARARDDADPMTSAPPRVPVTVVHGSLDDVVPASFSKAYARTFAAALVEPVADHFALVDPASGHFAPVAALIAQA
jgi:acetyl esterase/lipase